MRKTAGNFQDRAGKGCCGENGRSLERRQDRPLERKQTFRYVKKADTAILFIHGILGIPEYFRPYLALVPPDWSVCQILLKGHGGKVRDLSAASMEQWKQQVEKEYRTLSRSHDKVVIAAHSMGTLLALQQVLEKPAAALFLVNVPFRVRIRPELFRIVWKVFWGNIRPGDSRALAAQRAYGMDRDWHILRYLGWIPRYRELFAEIRKTRNLAPVLTTRCRVYLSEQDEMVSPESGRVWAGNPYVTVTMLKGSGHFYYSPEACKQLQEGFCQMVREVQTRAKERKA